MMRDSTPFGRHKFMHTATIVIVIVVVYGVVFTTPMLRHISVGVDTVQKLLVEREPSSKETPAPKSFPPTTQSDYIPPMWSCKDTDRKKKLVFSHIFKTAGSSMRSLLRSYAEQCQAGYVTVINCGAVKLESLTHGNNWIKDNKFRTIEHGTDCKLKTTIFRNNTEVSQAGHEGPMNTTYLEDAKVDILSGHVSVGVDHEWKDDKGQHVDVQYLTFFREGTHKFVSAILYLRPKLTFEEAVVQIKESVRKRVERGEYLSDIANLMTPVQRDSLRLKNITLSPEEGADLMIQNLKEQNILVGIVERMSESLELLQHLVDKDGELDSLFESYGKLPPGVTESKEIKANKSRLSSSNVLAEVEKDEEFMNVMHEFVKWDKKVYDFALSLHMRQYQALKQRYPKAISQTVDTKEPTVSETTKRTKATAIDSLSSAADSEDTSPKPVDESDSDSHESIIEPVVEVEGSGNGTDSQSSLPKSVVETSENDFRPDIQPIWSCSDSDRTTKLSFVHIFKTAGSSIRALLRAYATQCNAGLSIIVNCAPVDPDSLETGTWEKKPKFKSRKHGTACKLKNTIYRNNTHIEHSPGPGHDVPINTTYLKDSKIDIIGGHITMGVDQFWTDDDGHHVDMQYLSFFRESMRKVVSAVVFMFPDLSFDEAVKLVKDRVRKNLSKSVYLDNSNYIITPAQQAKYRNVTLSPEDRAKLVIQNMKEHKFLFGIVERMSESLEMLQYVVDKDGALDSLFEKYGKIPPGTNKTRDIVKNRSKLSSSEVLEEVKKDEEFMKEFAEYVKYDEMVYDFALEQHLRQYEAFQKQSTPDAAQTIKQMQQIPIAEDKVEVATSDAVRVPVAIDVQAELGDYDGKIEPMWRCKDTDRKRKLVFVHLFKSAGSSMRTLLRRYSSKCNAGLAIAIGCAPVLPESIPGNWIQDSQKKPHCVLKQLVDRNNTINGQAGPVNATILTQSNTDILGGHITLGTEAGWKDDKGDDVDVQYFTFLREGKRMYVSSVLYLHPELTFDEAVARLKSQVTQNVRKGQYFDVSRYLITPAQRLEHRNSTLTTEQNAKLVIKNLKEKNVLVGIVERMSESLEMLQRVVDKDGEMDATFESFGKIPPGTNKTKTVKANQSKLSSGAVLEEAEKDEEFMKLFHEFVKYHDKIYQFSWDMHMRQYEAAFSREDTVTQK